MSKGTILDFNNSSANKQKAIKLLNALLYAM